MTELPQGRLGGFFCTLRKRMADTSVRCLIAVLIVAGCSFSGGCAERRIAPELKYSQAEADELTEKIRDFDW
jgi:hypothetical protein